MHIFPTRFCGLPKGVWETAVFSPRVQMASNTSCLWGRPGGAAGQGYRSLLSDSIPESLRAKCAAALRTPRLRTGFSSHGQTAGGAQEFIGIERHGERGSLWPLAQRSGVTASGGLWWKSRYFLSLELIPGDKSTFDFPKFENIFFFAKLNTGKSQHTVCGAPRLWKGLSSLK